MLTHIKADITGTGAIHGNGRGIQSIIPAVVVSIEWHPFVELDNNLAIIHENISKVIVSGYFMANNVQIDIAPIFIDNTEKWQFRSELTFTKHLAINYSLVDFNNFIVVLK